ncbi:hypothetical protein [Streptomyces sp. NBC_00140]|uniref:hypothetical protein n=1 Tax=Streptomyces sp. NBC_00140 TaxID=2975664 RepID=UPI00225411B5|nr:hypothetical protein [Streptomyces sp. NBC_00140]MCX5332690.1 hypothetical protein [Streptomyces sp. NBC_00140]MCX5362087.1 hypothetical protein [Streptomyces sp. NBC_00124]
MCITDWLGPRPWRTLESQPERRARLTKGAADLDVEIELETAETSFTYTEPRLA